jgi:hypothetical protein
VEEVGGGEEDEGVSGVHWGAGKRGGCQHSDVVVAPGSEDSYSSCSASTTDTWTSSCRSSRMESSQSCSPEDDDGECVTLLGGLTIK